MLPGMRRWRLDCRFVLKRPHQSNLPDSQDEYHLERESPVGRNLACCCCWYCGMKIVVGCSLLDDVDGMTVSQVVGKIFQRLDVVVVDGTLIEVVHLVKVGYMVGREYQIRSQLWHLGLFRLRVKDSWMV